jgi:exosortase K
MNHHIKWSAQLFVVLLCALGLKYFYSTASVDQLRWILAPTTFLVELLSGRSFEFEAHAGYMSSDNRFLIAASCAGVNFLLTAFLMLSLRKLWRDRLRSISWFMIPLAAVFAYIATLIANTARICIALELQQHPLNLSWLSANQLHRLEGIVVYFGFLLFLFMLTERLETSNPTRLMRFFLFPLAIYYGIALGVPLLNGAYKQGTSFTEHSLFVLLTPLLLTLPLFTYRLLSTLPFSNPIKPKRTSLLRAHGSPRAYFKQ